MEKGSYRIIYSPAPCILKISGPIKGGGGDRVLRTLGLSYYTVILALPGCLATLGACERGMATRQMRAGWEYFMLPLVQSTWTALTFPSLLSVFTGALW